MRTTTVIATICLSFSVALAQTVVDVRGSAAQIQLANGGSRWGNDQAPANAPVLVDITLRPGEALQFAASGQVNLDVRSASQTITTGPDGISEPYRPGRSFICSGRGCIGNIWARRGALIGVFMSSDRNLGGNLLADYYSAAEHLQLIQPLTGQPFLIGTGLTPGGFRRAVVVPNDASRLYLGVLEGEVNDNAGSFRVEVTSIGFVSRLNVNPLAVLATSQPLLAGAGPGGNLGRGTFGLEDFSPLNSPTPVDIRDWGSTLRIGAIGSADLNAQLTAIGPGGIESNVHAFSSIDVPSGFSNIAAPVGSLVGVFVGRQIRNSGNAFTSDFSTPEKRNAESLAPVLQQFFYIGTGRTDSGQYRRITVPEGAEQLLLGLHSGRSQPAHDNRGAFFVTIVPDRQRLPSFDVGTIAGAAGFTTPPAVAGGIISIFGRDLSFGSGAAATVPLPRQLGETAVWIDGIPAPLFAVFEQQINVQIPAEVEGRREVQVVVSNGRPGVPVFLPLVRANPGIFTVSGKVGVVVNAATNRLVSSSEPVRAGDTLIIYASGLGRVDPPAATGAAASMSVLSRATTPIRVGIGGVMHDPDFAGLAPGFVGVNQINVRIGPSVREGPAELYLDCAGSESNRVEIFVAR